MDGLVVDTTLTLADWNAYLKAYTVRLRVPTNFWWTAAIAIGAAAITFAVCSLRGQSLDWPSLFLGAAVVFGSFLLGQARLRKLTRPQGNGGVLGTVRYTMDPAGLQTERKNSRTATNWVAIREVEVAPEHLFLWIDRIAAHIVPVRDLPPGISAQQLADQIRTWATRPMAPPEGAEGPSGTQTVQSGWPLPARARETRPVPQSTGTWRTLVRMLTLQPVDIQSLAADDRWLASLAAITLGLWVAGGRWDAGPQAEWYGSGLPGVAWYAVFVLALAWMTARLTSPRLSYRSVLLALAAFLPASVAAYLALKIWAQPILVISGKFLLLLLGFVYLDRYLRRLGGVQAGRALLVAAIFTFSFGWISGEIWVSSDLWYGDDGSAEAEASWKDQEHLLFAQPDRIDAEVGLLHPGDPGGPDVFFVGFAGYAEQRVFAEEIKLAASVVGARYHSTDRSLMLVNDRRDLESKPMATVSGLRRALAGVADRMDVSQDILFLALSSHGAADPSLSVSNGILPLTQLTGTALKEALDASGIRWRVIVISACHAGAFIDSVKDANTIILTAAAADRTSFGCSDTRDLTYFGEAFFRDALPDAPTLRDAFESARKSIAAREAREERTPSEPQAYFGNAIERRWADVERSR